MTTEMLWKVKSDLFLSLALTDIPKVPAKSSARGQGGRISYGLCTSKTYPANCAGQTGVDTQESRE